MFVYLENTKKQERIKKSKGVAEIVENYRILLHSITVFFSSYLSQTAVG